MGYSTSQNVGGATNTATLTDSQNRITTVTKTFDNAGNVGLYITPPSAMPRASEDITLDDSFMGLSGNSLLYIGIACLVGGALLFKRH